ncbi:VOC family protein [Streptomyces sp. NPDC090499]|uniref:VOC family protein n=1 Tax=unclassified Streptomyces TaxID=2593676 RepID=UPI003828A7DB
MATPSAPAVLGLDHAAYRCRDAEETRHFYEDVLGLRLVHTVREEAVVSTGEPGGFVHLFFELSDGSSMAFFDLGDGEAAQPSPNTPPWVTHIAFKLSSQEALAAMKARVESHGVDVLGVIDHESQVSIYFFDPNGIRLEFTFLTATAEQRREYAMTAHDLLKEWDAEKPDRQRRQAAAAGARV